MDYENIEEFKKGGRVKRRRKNKKQKKPKTKIKTKIIYKEKQPQGAPPSFSGVALPTQAAQPTIIKPSAPSIDENLFSKLESELRKSREQQEEVKRQLKQIEDIKNRQQASGQALIPYEAPQRELMRGYRPKEEKEERDEKKEEDEFKYEELQDLEDLLKIEDEPQPEEDDEEKKEPIEIIDYAAQAARNKRIAKFNIASVAGDIKKIKQLLKSALKTVNSKDKEEEVNLYTDYLNRMERMD